MERYEAYKDSGVEWIGEIPSGWEVRRIKNDCAVIAGATPKSDIQEYWDGEIPWITPADYSETQHYIGGGSRSITELGLDSCGTTLVPKGSVIVSNRAPIGLVSVASCSLCTNQGCKAIVPQNDEVSSEYLFWYLLTQTEALNSFGRGTTFLELSTQALGAFVYPRPHIREQQAIADYLDARTAEIDALVEDCEREVELLRELRKAVISEAVTKGLDPDAPMKDSGVEWIGEIPEHWDSGKLLRHARLESGHTPSRLHPEWWIEDECTIPWITTQDVHRFRDGRITSINDTELHVSQVGLDNSSARWLPAGTVALSRTASVGFSIVLSEPMASSQDYADWVPDESLDSFYLLYSLRSMDMVFRQLQMGSTHKTIYMPDIMKLAIAYPPIEEQRAIVSYLDVKTVEIDSFIDAKQSMAEKLREYRRSLISEAVTGKFKVPGL